MTEQGLHLSLYILRILEHKANCTPAVSLLELPTEMLLDVHSVEQFFTAFLVPSGCYGSNEVLGSLDPFGEDS